MPPLRDGAAGESLPRLRVRPGGAARAAPSRGRRAPRRAGVVARSSSGSTWPPGGPFSARPAGHHIHRRACIRSPWLRAESAQFVDGRAPDAAHAGRLHPSIDRVEPPGPTANLKRHRLDPRAEEHDLRVVPRRVADGFAATVEDEVARPGLGGDDPPAFRAGQRWRRHVAGSAAAALATTVDRFIVSTVPALHERAVRVERVDRPLSCKVSSLNRLDHPARSESAIRVWRLRPLGERRVQAPMRALRRIATPRPAVRLRASTTRISRRRRAGGGSLRARPISRSSQCAGVARDVRR